MGEVKELEQPANEKSDLITSDEFIAKTRALPKEDVAGRVSSKLAYQYLETITRDLPSEMPIKELTKVSGQSLLDAGHKEYQGKPIVPGLFYTVFQTVPKKFNHLKRLKRAYKDLGGRGVFIYGLGVFSPEFWTEWREVVNETFKERIPQLREEVEVEKLSEMKREAEAKLAEKKEVEEGAEQVQG